MAKTISIRFKDKNKVFKGKIYDYRVLPEEDEVRVGDVIRMFDGDCNPFCYGTRVRVEKVRETTDEDINLIAVRVLKTTLDD